MFDQMRKNTKTILWITIAAFLGLIFLAWGAEFQLGGKKRLDPNTVGVVNGTPITAQAYSQALTQAKANYQQQSGRDVDDRTDVMIRNQTWNDLVQQVLLRQEVQKRGIRVSNDEIVQAILTQPPQDIMSNPQFQTNGQFDLGKWQAALRNPNVDTRPLEEQYRSSLPLQKLQMQIAGTVAVSDDELWQAYVAQNEKLKVSYVMIPSAKFPVNDSSIPEGDLEAYYNAHKETYRQAPTAVVQYVSVPRRYTEQDSVNVVEQGRQVLKELKDGEDFGVLVDAYSEAQPALRGGDNAAWLTAAQITDPVVRNGIMSLEPGQVSDLLIGPNGVHVIKLLDKRAHPGADSVKVADVFIPLKPSPETLTQLQDEIQQFHSEVEKRSFEEVAAEMKLSVKETPPFTETGFVPGIGSAQDLQDFAFRSQVGAISPPIERPDSWVVARLKERRPARIPDFKEIMDRVRKEAADSLATEQAVAAAQPLLQRAESGVPLATVAASDPRAVYDQTDPFGRVNSYPKGIGNDPAVIGALFATQTNGVVPHVLRTRNGAFIVSIDQRIPADRAQFENQKAQLRQNLFQRRQSQAVTEWLASLKKNAKIEDYRFGRFES